LRFDIEPEILLLWDELQPPRQIAGSPTSLAIAVIEKVKTLPLMNADKTVAKN
jgi:hypothetical protein